MEGGYCRIKPTDGNQMSITPYKDGFYEHPMDAQRYLVDGIARGGGLNSMRASDTINIAEPNWIHTVSQGG
jgi:hypothetical protein